MRFYEMEHPRYGMKKKTIYIPDAKKLYKSNIILVPDEVTPATIAPIAQQALALHMVNTKAPISVIVNSPGGECESGFMLIDILLGMRRPVVTYALGEACSMGLLIYLAGDLRIATPRSMFLAHQYTWGTHDKYHELKSRRAIEDWYHRRMREYVGERASKEAAALLDKESDQWLTAVQAKKLGIVHKIVKCVNIPRFVYVEPTEEEDEEDQE